MPGSRPSAQSRREVSAGGVVFRLTGKNPEFLLIKAKGRWLFPKGNIEKGETSEKAALREISEETGLPNANLRIVKALPSIEYIFRWEGKLVFKTVNNFLVEARGQAELAPQLSEVEQAAWFDAESARKALSFKNSRETLDAAIAAVESMLAKS